MSLRLANLDGRAVVVQRDGLLDVERASGGRFGSDPMALLADWDALTEWAAGAGAADAPVDEARLGPCVPRPRQVFGIGLNYRDHAEEAGLAIPETPLVFTKFPSCLVGPRAQVSLSGERVDWEVELVAVIGRGGRRIPEAMAFDHVAGYCVGQDISDRRVQFEVKPPQFSLGKSFDGYGPIGPWVVGLDAFADPNDLALTCDISGERMQDSRTSQLIFAVPELVARLSAVCALAPGDLIFTGTPAGVGGVRDPRRYLAPGDVITSEIEGIGRLENVCRAAASGETA